jgi:hypothetical protein
MMRQEDDLNGDKKNNIKPHVGTMWKSAKK